MSGSAPSGRLCCNVWHASGYIMANMTRWVLILVVLTVAVVTWLSGGAGIQTQTSPGSASSRAVASIPLETPSDNAERSDDSDSVQVVYDLIHVTPAPTRAAPQPPKAAPAVRKAAVQRAEDSDRRPDSSRLIARASRVLLGDGRHRPQPFPKPAD